MGNPVVHFCCPLCGRLARSEAFTQGHAVHARTQHFRGGRGRAFVWSPPHPISHEDLVQLADAATATAERLRAMLGDVQAQPDIDLPSPVRAELDLPTAPQPEPEFDIVVLQGEGGLDDDDDAIVGDSAATAPEAECVLNTTDWAADPGGANTGDRRDFVFDLDHDAPSGLAARCLAWLNDTQSPAARRAREAEVDVMVDEYVCAAADDEELAWRQGRVDLFTAELLHRSEP